ncbi:hypothetical protein ACJIZ3_006783 [Penstemon smallii]|uniref:Uncharacterized protein n=1 Tax=Penstemon smallii TaxID=265156 RepID=A0ABD3S8W3_9LAMI
MISLVQPLQVHMPVEPKKLGSSPNQESFHLHHSRSILHVEYPTLCLQ